MRDARDTPEARPNAARLRLDADVVAEVQDRVGGRGREDPERQADLDQAGELASAISCVAQLLAEALEHRREPIGDERSRVADVCVGLVVSGATPAMVRDVIHTSVAVGRTRLLESWEANSDRGSIAGLDEAVALVADVEFGLLRAFDEAVRCVEDEGVQRSHRMREAFLRRILQHPVYDPAATTRRATALGLDLLSPIGVVLLQAGVVDPSDAGSPADDGLENCVARGMRQISVPSVGPVFLESDPTSPPFAIVLVSRIDESRAAHLRDDLDRVCTEHGLLAVLAVAAGVGRLPATFRRLEATTPILERCAMRLGPVMTLDALFPYVAVQELTDEEAEELLRSEVGPLKAKGRGASERVETWRLFVQEQPTAARAAELLHVAESTVRSRKAVIERLIGHPLGDHLFREQVTSYLLDLWEDDLPPAGDPWWTGDRPCEE